MSELKLKIIEKIQKGEIKKTSRWYFLTKRYVFWITFVISIVFGALSFSVFLNNILDEFGPWYKLKIESFFWTSNVFWIWILFLVIFIMIAVLNFKQTKRSFKIHFVFVIGFSILASLILGFTLYSIHVGENLNKQILLHSKRYSEMRIKKKNMLSNYLKREGIDEIEFFTNRNIKKIRRDWKVIDQQRIERLKLILEEFKGLGKERELRILFDKIKEKKKEVDYQRFLKEVEIYKENMLK